MFFELVYDKTLAQAGYIIGCQACGVAAVIDPKRDVDTFINIAKQNKLQITHIFETHIHADFLTGSRELAKLTGAKLYLSDEGGPDWQYEFEHEGLHNGDIIEVGNLKFEVLHTPGHTPESISFLLTDKPASNEPVMLFTGDFVFVGDVGRPDLLEKAAGIAGTKEAGAEQMYQSIQRFNTLPDFIQLWPGHGAGSACGKALGAVPSSTVGYEKIRNWAFQFPNKKNEFIDTLLDGQPEPPKYFAMMKKLNKVDRPLLTEVPMLKKLGYEDLKSALENKTPIIDTRHKTDFAAGFIPGSINIQNNNSFATWAGWFIKYDQPIILIADEKNTDDLMRKLMRIGLDNVIGFVPSIDVWTNGGGKLEQVKNISFEDFENEVQNKNSLIVDIRNNGEFAAGHIDGAKHVFIGTLPDNLNEIPRETPVIIHCQAGDRSSIGYSILAKEGFKNITNYPGGYAEWTKKSKEAVS